MNSLTSPLFNPWWMAHSTLFKRCMSMSHQPGLQLVTPGIRPAGSAGDDQRRILTPRAALDAGSDYLVIGRPISQAADPAAALQNILGELG